MVRLVAEGRRCACLLSGGVRVGYGDSQYCFFASRSIAGGTLVFNVENWGDGSRVGVDALKRCFEFSAFVWPMSCHLEIDLMNQNQ